MVEVDKLGEIDTLVLHNSFYNGNNNKDYVVSLYDYINLQDNESWKSFLKEVKCKNFCGRNKSSSNNNESHNYYGYYHYHCGPFSESGNNSVSSLKFLNPEGMTSGPVVHYLIHENVIVIVGLANEHIPFQSTSRVVID